MKTAGELRVNYYDYLTNSWVRCGGSPFLAKLEIGKVLACELDPELVCQHLAVPPTSAAMQITGTIYGLR